MTALTGPADLRDARRLAELERTIHDGMTSFVAVGEALLEVRASQLYRLGYATFEAYCRGRWQFTDQRARQLMSAVETVKALPESATTVATESQARELGPVLREHGPEVAAQVMAEASADGPATAATIRAAAAPFRPRIDPSPDPYFADRVAKAAQSVAAQSEREAHAAAMALMPPDPDAERAAKADAWTSVIRKAGELLHGVRVRDYADYLNATDRADTDVLIGLIEDWVGWTRSGLAEPLRLVRTK